MKPFFGGVGWEVIWTIAETFFFREVLPNDGAGDDGDLLSDGDAGADGDGDAGDIFPFAEVQ